MTIRCGCCHDYHESTATVRACWESRRGVAASARSNDRSAVPALSEEDIAHIAGLDLQGVLLSALASMTSLRHADVLRMRLGAGETPPLTLERIGHQLGVSRERVRQLEDKARPRLVRQLKASSDGQAAVAQLVAATRPQEPGFEDRFIAITALLLPEWAIRPSRKLIAALIGKPRSPAIDDTRAVHERSGDPAPAPGSPGSTVAEGGHVANLYEAVAEQFGGLPVAGAWKRFESTGWFHVGQTIAECPACGLVLEGFRRPYVTSANVEYHYWGLVCLKCRSAWAPTDLDTGLRKALYDTSGMRPQPLLPTERG